MRRHTSITAYKDESRLFFVALTCLLFSVSAYVYYVSASVSHVVMRKEVDQEMSALETRTGDLEAEYIEIQHEVSGEIASMKGFAIADKKIFIDTSDSLVVLRN